MSGPKVVRIVTREEWIEICARAMRDLDAAIAEWRRAEGDVDAAADADVLARRESIVSLLAEDRFDDVQSAVQVELGRLRQGAERAHARAAERLARRRGAARRAKAGAASVLEALSGMPSAPADLIEELTALSRSAAPDLAATDAALQRGFAVLADASTAQQGMSAAAAAMAAALGERSPNESFADWLDRQPQSGPEARVEAEIGRLEAEFGDAAVAPFIARLDAAIAEVEPTRRRMRLDSLALDVSAACKAARAQADTRQELERLKAELQMQTSIDATEALALISAALAGEGGDAAQALAAGRRATEEAAAVFAAAAQRKAIFDQLRQLGYSVEEGMATALAEQRQVVIQSPVARDYGVEVTEAGQRFQLRTVAFGRPGDARDQARDLEVETAWCGDFQQARAQLAKAGGDIRIDMAKAVGETPLKIVARPSDDSARADAVARPRHRQRDL